MVVMSKRYELKDIFPHSQHQKPRRDVELHVYHLFGICTSWLSVRDCRPLLLSAMEDASRFIFARREELSAIITQHDSTISRRWAKKTHKERVEIFQSSWPASPMPETHRTDIQMLFQAETQRTKLDRDHPFLDICPYFTVEDLEKSAVMLNILRLRAIRHPVDFLKTDTVSLSCTKDRFDSFEHLDIDPMDFVFFRRSKRPEAYATFGIPELPPPLNSTRHFYIPEAQALQVLSLQCVIMAFLSNFVDSLLPDASTLQLIKQSRTQDTQASSSAGTTSLFSVEAAYAYSTGVDLDLLIRLVTTRREEAIDEFRSMREDPGFYQGRMQEAVEDSRYNDARKQDPEHWMAEAVLHASDCIHRWSRILDQCTLAQQYYQDGAILDFLKAQRMMLLIGELYGMLGHQIHLITTKRLLPTEFRRCMRPSCNPLDHLEDVDSEVLQRPELQFDLYIWWMERDIKFRTAALPHMGMYLQHLMQRYPARRLVKSHRVQSVIADITLCCICIQQLQMTTLWHQYHSIFNYSKKLNTEIPPLRSDIRGSAQFPSQVRQIVARLGSLDNQRFYYPCHLPKTEQNVKSLRQAERNLEAFWTEHDRLYLAVYSTDPSLHEAVLEAIKSPRNPRVTPTWEQLRSQAISKRIDASDTADINKSLSEIHFELEHRTERTILQDTPLKTSCLKKKGKNRNSDENVSPGRDLPAPAVLNAPLPTTPTETTIAVSRRALKVFQALFFTESISSTPGQVSWRDFVHAMESAGFMTQRLQGSAWHFMPQAGSSASGRSIHFHEPHPVDKLAYFIARHYGRRLVRAYGWSSKTFIFAGNSN